MSIDRVNPLFFSEKRQITLSNDLNIAAEVFDCALEPVFLSDLLQYNDDYLTHDWDENYTSILNWCADVISKSPTGRLLLKEAAQEDWRIDMSDTVAANFHIDVSQRIIFLSHNDLDPIAISRSSYFCNVVLVSFIQSLREVWQEKRHGGFDERYSPENVLMLERVRSADCDVMGAFVAWELRNADYPEVWRHLVGGSDGDVAMALMHYIQRNPTAQSDHKAMLCAFNQWFDCEERVNKCDHATLEYLDDVMYESDIRDPFGKCALTDAGIEVLSCQPDRTAYLQGIGADILSDPYYAGLHSEINQTHFFHLIYDIKVTHVGGVPFRCAKLAAKFFPDEI